MLKNEDYIIREVKQPWGIETFKNYVRDGFDEQDLMMLQKCNDFEIAEVYSEMRAVPKDEICIKCGNRWTGGNDINLCDECHEIEIKKPWSKYL